MKLIQELTTKLTVGKYPGAINLDSKNLTSLPDDLPYECHGTFNCTKNKLTNLKGSPTTINVDFYCGFNDLTTLVGGPKTVDGSFGCSNMNKLDNLEGAPTYVGKNFRCTSVGLKSISGAPKSIGGKFDCSDNQLVSLHLIHTHIHRCSVGMFPGNPITSHVLGLLKIEGLKRVELDNIEVAKIINKYLPKGDIFDCQEELIEAGFEEYAQL